MYDVKCIGSLYIAANKSQKYSSLTPTETPRSDLTTFNRELVSYRVAKQILDSGQKLEPEIKDYLQYIVNLHEGIEDISVPYSKTQSKKLDPEAAKNLQKTLDDFVQRTGVPVTESFIEGGE